MIPDALRIQVLIDLFDFMYQVLRQLSLDPATRKLVMKYTALHFSMLAFRKAVISMLDTDKYQIFSAANRFFKSFSRSMSCSFLSPMIRIEGVSVIPFNWMMFSKIIKIFLSLIMPIITLCGSAVCSTCPRSWLASSTETSSKSCPRRPKTRNRQLSPLNNEL